MPTLVVRGEKSQELSSEIFKRMIASNPNITGVEIPNAGHWVHADQSARFAETVLEFANR